MANATKLPDNAGVIMFPPLLYLLALTAGLLVSRFFPNPFLSVTAALPAGIALVLVGVAVVWSAAVSMNRHKTAIHPAGVTTTIVSEGIYGRTRNPMYISFTLIYSGILLMFNAWFGFVLLIPLLVLVEKGIIEREEHYLTRKFGNEYLTYKKQVRRWF